MTDKQERFTLLKPEDERLDSLLAPEFKSKIVFENAEGARNLIIDLSSVTYIDSSGLSAILVANRLCTNQNGTFVLTGLQPAVKKLIELSKLESVLAIVPTVEEAKDYVMMEEVQRDLTSDEQ